MSRFLSTPRTLKGGAAPADRRVLSGQKLATSAPTTLTDGHVTDCKRYLHVSAQAHDAGSSADLVLWGYSEVDNAWAKVVEFGTAGTLGIAVADGVVRRVVEIRGLHRVHLQLINPVGMGAVGVDAWLAANTF